MPFFFLSLSSTSEIIRKVSYGLSALETANAESFPEEVFPAFLVFLPAPTLGIDMLFLPCVGRLYSGDIRLIIAFLYLS